MTIKKLETKFMHHRIKTLKDQTSTIFGYNSKRYIN